ncbi:hypothetical protein ACWCW7_18880 [Nocardia tengchongensis]
MRQRTTEWFVTGCCAVLTVVVCVTAALLLSHGSSSAIPAKNSSATPISLPTTTKPDPAHSIYHVDHIANACDLVDLAPFTRYQPLEPGTPIRHTETQGDRPALDCDVTLKDYSKVVLKVFESQSDARGIYDSSKKAWTTITNPDQQVGAVPGLGTDNYFSVRLDRDTYYTDVVTVDYRLEVFDADVTVQLWVFVEGFNKGLTADAIARPAQDQVRAILSKLHR